jgi:hypothetical protein
MLGRAADLGRTSAASQLRLDGSPEAVWAKGVLPLQVESYGYRVILGNRLANQLPVRQVSPGRVSVQR